MERNKSTKEYQLQLEEILTLKDFFSQCINHWLWFVISILAFMLGAVFYLTITPKMYERSAKILIKQDEKNNNSFTNQLINMGNLDIFGNISNVNNEIICIQSPDILFETIKRLKLDYNYSTNKYFFNNGLLYQTSLPFEVIMDGLSDEQDMSLKLQIINQKIIISDICTTKNNKSEVDEKQYQCSFNSSVSTAFGTIHIKRNDITDIEQSQTIYVRRNGYHKALKKLQNRLTFVLEDDHATIINMKCNDEIPNRAEDILSTIITVYNESWVRDKNLMAISTSQFINERIKVIEKELTTVDSDISTFKSDNQMTDFNISNSQALNETASSGNSIRLHTNEMYMIKYIRTYLSQSINSPQILPTGLGLSNQPLVAQINQYNEILLQRNNIARNSSSQNPLVVKLDDQLRSLCESVLISLDNEEIRLNKLITSEENNINKYSTKISETPSLEKDLREIERQQNVKESLYLYLLQKREENELNQAFTAYNTRLVATPDGNLSPSSPNSAKILLIALFLAIIIPFITIFIITGFNTTVRGRKDIENLTVPFVGEIPLYKYRHKHHESNSTNIVIKAKGRTVIEESFRVVRTNIEFLLNQNANRGKVFMLTSFNPGSGKTFLSLNLAASFALMNKRVLIVDLDMRKSSISKVIGNPQNGISNYIAGYSESCEIYNVQDTQNLFMAPVGTTPPNPTEILYNTRLNDLFIKWRNEFDYIIIDCPPVEIVADAGIISKWADVTLFVVRTGLLDRSMLPDITQYYENKKFNNLMLLLNGTDYSNNRYSYYSKYNYGYYHSYHNYYTEK
ncbi:MAG: polysaccharide biosynthesis tyrosine autokinase [Paludibacteraceae bacterium]|nr:polysaccharide biosynthesis tyrosine autokinase [Paludibacteraceae bacterium]